MVHRYSLLQGVPAGQAACAASVHADLLRLIFVATRPWCSFNPRMCSVKLAAQHCVQKTICV
jgi:hypothetical protein